MSHVYSPIGSGAYVGAYTMPDDGDPRNASAFNVPMEGMAEDLKRIKAALDAGEVSYSTTRHFEFTMTPSPSNWSRAYEAIFTRTRYWNQTAHASLSYVEATLDLPDGFIIQSVTAWFNPGTGRAGAPGTPPTIRLLRQNNETATASSLADATDPVTTPTLAAFEQLHSLTATLGTPHAVVRSNSTYAAVFSGESGANAINGTNLYSVKVTGTMAKVY